MLAIEFWEAAGLRFSDYRLQENEARLRIPLPENHPLHEGQTGVEYKRTIDEDPLFIPDDEDDGGTPLISVGNQCTDDGEEGRASGAVRSGDDATPILLLWLIEFYNYVTKEIPYI